MECKNDAVIYEIIEKNRVYQQKYTKQFIQHVQGQSPKIAILTCADSRVIPELIFQQTIGDVFVVRIAGNIAVDPTVLTSLEYAVDHLHVSYLIILGHTHCGAVKAAEQTKDTHIDLIHEIRKSFPIDETDHIKANVKRQLSMIPKRSTIIETAMKTGTLSLIGAIYHLDTGNVEFL